MQRIRSLISATAIAAGLAVLAASPAGALPAGEYEPPDTTDRPDLKVTALAATPSGSNWSISYTVANHGLVGAGSFKLGLSGATSVPMQISQSSLAAGASRSGTVQVARTAQCFVFLTATADVTAVVAEQSETNNSRGATGVVPGCPPRYRIAATSFKAIDESGADWTGSDEPYWIFNTVSNGGTASSKASQIYGSIDSGDTQSFAAVDSCLWGCAGGGAEAPFGVGLNVQLWESDLGHVDQTLYDVADAFQAIGPIVSVGGAPAWVGAATSAMGTAMEFILGWADDDLLGSSTYAYSTDYLASALPSRGMSFTDTRTYTNGDAVYTLTMVVSRIV